MSRSFGFERYFISFVTSKFDKKLEQRSGNGMMFKSVSVDKT